MWADIQRNEADLMSLAWPKYVSDWRQVLSAYKRDQSNPNPFKDPDPGKLACVCPCTLKLIPLIEDALDKLKTQLAKEDLEQRRTGVGFLHEMSPAEFFQRAIDIETAQ